MGTFALNGGSMQATMKYDYSTKNFHRFAAASGTPKEVYIPRSEMPQPVAEIQVAVTIPNVTPVLERVKAK